MPEQSEPGQVESFGFKGVFLRWPDEKKGPFVLEATWVMESGRPVCMGLSVWRDVEPAVGASIYTKISRSEPLKGLGGTDLRSIPLAHVLERLWVEHRQREVSHRKEWRQPWGVEEAAWVDEQAPGLRSAAARMLASPLHFDAEGPRRRQADDRAHFAAVAAVYEAAYRIPGRKRPTEAVRQHFAVSYSTATKWVHQARKLGLLPPTTPGKPAGVDDAKRRPKRGTR